MADLTGGEAGGVVLGPNMTTLTYRMATALAKTWGPGDEIVVSELDHDANVRPWVQAAASAGARVIWARVDPQTTDLPAGQYAELVTSRTRLVAVAAASNLIENAFKFSRPGGTVTLSTRTTPERVFIDVSDACGGLPAGKVEELFRPFKRGESNQSGLGLGLSIALAATRANSGELHVRDVPGVGCVFTIDWPREAPPPNTVYPD